MDIQTKHYNKILDAKCQVVCIADSLVKKSNYGDNIECCSENLFAAVNLINRLDCYCFPIPGTATTLSVFSYTINYISFSFSGSINLLVNNVSIGILNTFIGQNAITAFNNFFTSIGLNYTVLVDRSNTTWQFTMPCDTLSMVTDTYITSHVLTPLTIIQAGICGTSPGLCNNCFDNASLDKAYQTLDFLLK